MVKFTKSKDELLIECVKANRVIFDASHKDHKNVIEKHKCWETIGCLLQVPVPDCKKRWKSLRDQYNSKKKKSESTGEERRSSNWEYMNIMSFLDTAETCEATDLCDSILHTVDEDNNERQGDQCNNEQSIGDETNDDIDTDEITVPQNRRRATKRNFSEPQKTLVKGDAQQSALHDFLIKKTLESKTHLHKFFDSMADIAIKLPPQLQAEIRVKVCQIVTEVEVKYYMTQLK